MSWNLRSRKMACPRFRSGSRTAGPAATNNSSPTLNHLQDPSSRSARAVAAAASGTSRATMSRLRATSIESVADGLAGTEAEFRSSEKAIPESYGKNGDDAPRLIRFKALVATPPTTACQRGGHSGLNRVRQPAPAQSRAAGLGPQPAE